MKNLYLIIGPSGCGKSTLANELERYFDAKQVESYTTRRPRHDWEKGHRFVTERMFDTLRDKLVAYTKFDGAEYGVTKDILDESAFYVIDVDGALKLKDLYTRDGGDIFAIWLECDPGTCAERMTQDGRSPYAIKKRLEHDAEAFSDISWMKLMMAYGFNATFGFEANRSKDDVFMDVMNLITKLED